MITSLDIRQKFLAFFETKWHSVIPSAPVVPENDPTVLFTTAWMHPLVPYLLWEFHPAWKRLTNFQKCIRTWDIDEVWDNSHWTFFEMLGNWSLWDYFKKESIAWSFEFLTSKDWLWLDPKKLAVSVFAWDSDAPRDEESASIWQDIWIPASKISYLWKKDNWRWPAWQTWPCWPDTEIFYRVWDSEFPSEDSNVENDEDNWLEIWNNVFMEYIKDSEWNYNKASQQNVDTGMWLERVTAVLNWKKDIYSTDIFENIIFEISRVLKVSYEWKNIRGVRIIADHLRTAVFMIWDWVTPSNVDQWYVLRRLIRRAIREAHKMWYNGNFLNQIAHMVIWKFWTIYANLHNKKDFILDELDREEKQFLTTLEKWLREFDKLLKWFDIAFERTWKKVDTIAGNKAFKLYDTYGFPIEMTKELADEKWLKVDQDWFEKAFKEHQDLSRAWSEQKFKWWLADHWELTTALHSATHLMLAWLRKVLWAHVHQAGSNITAERLRFDFTHPEKLTPKQLQEVEDFVNEAINSNLKVSIDEVKKIDAENDPTIEWSFWEKYPDIVKVYSMVWENWKIYSRELCGWPHVINSEKMWRFKIKKEESSSRWVRRIKAVLIND